MSLLAAITTRYLDAATAKGFPTVLATTPRELKGKDLPAFCLRLVRMREYDHSPGLDYQQVKAEVEVVVFTPEPEDAPALTSGTLSGQAFGGRAGAQKAHDLAVEAIGEARGKTLRGVQYAGPTGGRDVFVTALTTEAYADVFND